MSYFSKETDARLMERIKRKDEKSFEQLYLRYRGIVYSLALKIVGSVGIAEEVTQEIFVKIWDNAISYDASKGSTITWLTLIARRYAIDKTRSARFKLQSRQVSLNSSENEVDVDGAVSEADAGTTMAMNEERNMVIHALRGFSETDRKVVELAYFQGLTHSRIAAELEMPLGTVKTKLRQAILRLRKELLTKSRRLSWNTKK